MRIPPDAIIPREKLTNYLLIHRDEDDKSKFLAQAGFTRDNADMLEVAIRHLAESADAVHDLSNQYGVFYRVEGNLSGPNGLDLDVVTVWIHQHADGIFRFVTLKPRRTA